MTIKTYSLNIFATPYQNQFNMKIKWIIFFIVLSFNAAAQQNEIELNPVTVIASLQPQPVSKTGRNISTIPGNYFNQMPVHSLDELLRYIPGVEVQSRGPMGAQSDIVIRGGTFQQVLIVLDNLRLNDPNTGHFNSYIPIAPAEIDRIEILKGAASAIYGSEAVGGVIHIITKTFAAKIKESKKQFAVQGTTGQYGLWSINAGGLYQNTNTAISGGLLTNNTDGQLQRGTRGYFKNNTASLSASHYFNEHLHLSVRAAYDKRKFSAQNFYTTFISDTAKETVASYWNQANLTYQKGAGKFVLDVGYKKAIDEYGFNAGALPNKNISSLFQMSSRYEHNFSPATALVSGMQFQNKSITSNDRGDHNLKQVAGFVILNLDIGKDVSLSPAIRLDHTENSGTELVPQLNISYKIRNIQLRGSAGKTIREADFTERYNNYSKTLVKSGSIGNPYLEAERSFSYEVGVDWFIQRELKISSGVFKRDQKKLIDWTTTPYSEMPRKDNLSATGMYALAKNIAEVNTTGFETDIQYSKSFKGREHLFATLGIIWLDSKSSDAVPSFYISSHAKFLANFSIVYTNQWFGFSANGIYKTRSAQTAPAINAAISTNYFLFNAKAEVFLLKNRAGIFIETSNVFNEKYSDLLGAQMPGRWIMAGFNFQFKQ